jgi:hypothetical protein
LFTMTLFLSLIGSVLDKKPYIAKHEKVWWEQIHCCHHR